MKSAAYHLQTGLPVQSLLSGFSFNMKNKVENKHKTDMYVMMGGFQGSLEKMKAWKAGIFMGR